jgi:galactokinase
MDVAALRSAFRKSFHADPEIIVRAPGRVNLLGEHTDYNDGFVLPVAIDRAVWVAASRCVSHLATIVALDFDQSATFRITELEPGRADGWVAYPIARTSAAGQAASGSGWAAYPAGVAWSLREAGYFLSGIDAVFASDVPIGVGLSSSAAVEVAFATAWQHLSRLSLPALDLARLCRRAENEYAGVKCGIMDQTISVVGRAGHALLLDCRDLSMQHVPLPSEYAIVVCDTRVERSLAASAYHQRQLECEEAVRSLQARELPIRALRDVTPEQLSTYGDELPEVVRRRARHVVAENARVLAGVEALRRDDVPTFGRAMIDSHASLRDDYEVSCRELDAMVEAALRVRGAIGARLTGAGFGGCVVSLVRDYAVRQFVKEVPAVYEKATDIKPALYVCAASKGAGVVAGR